MIYKKQKQIRLLNLIITPLGIEYFTPPFIFLTLFVNLLIDATVIYFALHFNNIILEKRKIVKKVLQAWVFGFFADYCALILQNILFIRVGIKSITVINLSAIAVAGLLIGIFNYRIFSKEGINRKACLNIALSMGIITAPWLLLLPRSFFLKLVSGFQALNLAD